MWLEYRKKNCRKIMNCLEFPLHWYTVKPTSTPSQFQPFVLPLSLSLFIHMHKPLVYIKRLWLLWVGKSWSGMGWWCYDAGVWVPQLLYWIVKHICRFVFYATPVGDAAADAVDVATASAALCRFIDYTVRYVHVHCTVNRIHK